MAKRNNFSAGLLTGVLLIIVGLVWVLINYDVLDVSVWNLWPLSIIFLGILILIRERSINNPVPFIMIIMSSNITYQSQVSRVYPGGDQPQVMVKWPVALTAAVFRRYFLKCSLLIGGM